MLRFVLLTCWLVGAGGGWGLGLAGLNAMGTGAGTYAELIVLGGASSWVAMLMTALRPGKRPNLGQRIFTVLAWLMPVGMFMLGDTFNLNIRLFSLFAAACVTMIVIIYPSQSPQLRLDEGRRLALHVRKQEVEQQAEQKRKGQSAPNEAAQGGSAATNGAWSAGVATPSTPVEPSSQIPAQSPLPSAPSASPARDGWAPRTPVQPADSPQADSGEGGSSRWKTPEVRRRGKLRDDRADERDRSTPGRGQ